MSDAITLRDVTLTYGEHPAVHHIAGVFRSGSLTAVLGPNGAGKSSLLKALAGLKRPASGQIEHHLPRATIGYMPQLADIDRTFPMSLLDFVNMGHIARVGLFGRINAAAEAQSLAALAKVGLDGFAARTLAELSAGQFQRALFARLIAQDAQVMLLDEPFNGVDARTGEALIAILKAWHADGRTIVLVMHDHDLARDLCPEALVIAREVLAWGPSRDVVNAEVLIRAKAMAEAFDEAAPLCAEALRA